MSDYPPYRSSSNNIKAELDIDLSNYATKDDVKKVEDKVDENEKELSFNRGFFFYLQKNHFVCECKSSSLDITIPANTTINKIVTWKSTGIFCSSSNNMTAVKNASEDLPKLEVVDDYYVHLSGNHFQENKTNVFNILNNIVINIYCVYKLDPTSSSRDDTFTVQNALFGSIQITKNADTSKYKYKGYGICFDEGDTFGIRNITNGRNVLIFGVHESSLTHANNKANNIFVMGDGFVQGINDTTLYAEKIYSQNFTQPNKTFVLSLHYNNNDSYLFINGKQELKFKAKPNQLIKNMPRPKILDVNEGIGEALFYPYKLLVNKCSGSCNNLDNPMSKICVPKIVKNVNMQVYNFLMRLSETRNVLWHEICNCVCKLSSSVCNNKQIWNDDTCTCDCNEDFAGIISCAKGYMWNPSTCECQCDKWCKQGQYLDHKNCVCKNKLIGRVIEECTSVINETTINNKDNITIIYLLLST